MLLQWNLDHILNIQKFRYTSGGGGSSNNMLLSDYESILKGIHVYTHNYILTHSLTHAFTQTL